MNRTLDNIHFNHHNWHNEPVFFHRRRMKGGSNTKTTMPVITETNVIRQPVNMPTTRPPNVRIGDTNVDDSVEEDEEEESEEEEAPAPAPQKVVKKGAQPPPSAPTIVKKPVSRK